MREIAGAHVKVGAVTGVVVMLIGVLLLLPMRFIAPEES